MINLIDITDFLINAKTIPTIVVRSPGEFKKGHIPGAFNIPLFNDDERAAVGTAYVQQGHDEAVELGLEFVGPKMAGFVKELKKTGRICCFSFENQPITFLPI